MTIKELEQENLYLKMENEELRQLNEELDTFDKSQTYKLLEKITKLKNFVKSVLAEECKYTKAEVEELLEL